MHPWVSMGMQARTAGDPRGLRAEVPTAHKSSQPHADLKPATQAMAWSTDCLARARFDNLR